MLPVNRFLSFTDPINRFTSLSYHNQRHTKLYVTGLIAATEKTIQGSSRHVMPALSERAVNKFLGEYDWEPEERNLDRLKELQHHNETR